MTLLDWALVGIVVLAAAAGARSGGVYVALSTAGFAIGASLGVWLGGLAFGDGGSPWLPLATLAAAIAGATIVRTLTAALGHALIARLPPSLRPVDASLGCLLGALLGAIAAWLLATTALYSPASGLRTVALRSTLVRELVDVAPPLSVLHALGRLDPLPSLPALAGVTLPAPDPAVLALPGLRSATDAVVRVEGTSCGLSVQGSGWAAPGRLVVTNVHVVTGERDTRVFTSDGRVLGARLVYADTANDVAILAVSEVAGPSLAVHSAPRPGSSVAILGYPSGGPLRRTPATISSPTEVVAPDAYGRVRLRAVIALRAAVHPGASGGPVVDRLGRVVGMVFASTEDQSGGVAITAATLRAALAAPRSPTRLDRCA